MGKVWKIVFIIALVLVVGGALLAGTGFITGASVDRVLVGVKGLQGLWDSAAALWRECLSALPF